MTESGVNRAEGASPGIPAQRLGNILWLVPKWPLPADDGARIATANLVRALASEGCVIDLAAAATADESNDIAEAIRELRVDNAFVIPRSRLPRSRLEKALGMGRAFLSNPAQPITMQPFAARDFRTRISELLASGRYETLVYDGLHPAMHAVKQHRYLRPAGVSRIVLRAHNVEADIWRRRARQGQNGPARVFLRYQSRLVSELERQVCAAADAVASVSSEDFAALQSTCPTIQGGSVRIGYTFGEPPDPPSGGEPRLMFLGRLDWPPNRDGLEWLLRQVWPKVIRRRPNLSLRVAGSGDATWCRAFHGLKGVRFLGRVDSVEQLYSDSSLSVVPVFYGSGTRVKVIEAARFARPCLSTALGVEGTGLTPGDSYLRAETAEEWIEALTRLTPATAQRLGHSAYSQLRVTFDPRRAARDFLALFQPR